ncbi:MAG: adenylate/guanylate cyclase domain-containing protein [Pseudomonadota bacterium]
MRKKRRIPLSTLLTGSVGILVTVTVILVLFFSAAANVRNTFDLMRLAAEQAMDALDEDIRAHLDPAASLINQLRKRVDQGRIEPSDNEAIARFASGAMAAAPQIAGLVVWDETLREIEVLRNSARGVNIKVGSGDDPEGVKVLASQLRALSGPLWGEPFFDDGVTYVNILSPLSRKGRFVGMAASGVTISDLSAFLVSGSSRYKVTPFILYGGKHVLAHPELVQKDAQTQGQSSDKGLIPINRFPDTVISQFHAAEVIQTPESMTISMRSLEVGDEEYFILSRELSGYSDKPWTIGVYAQEGRFDEQFDRLGWSILIGFALLAISIVVAWYLGRRLAAPVRQISEAAELVSTLDLSKIPKLRASHVKELDSQVNAFNRMTSALRLFETYVPKSLVTRMLRDSNPGAGKPHEQNLTVMFVDVIGFTSTSENMSPGEVAQLLNAYFTVVNRCIDAEGGTVDKYIGDAVMAFWGAPEAQEDHAARACRAALAIADAAENDPEFPDIRLKIALHTGPLLVGDIGAPGRINFTVIGDTVNTCSRIESLGSQIDDGSRVLVMASKETVDAAGGEFKTRKLGAFSVKGRARKVEVLLLGGRA